MAFKQTYNDYQSRKSTYARNQQEQNRRCTNCRYYNYDNGEYVCTRERYNGIIYRMPEPSIARGKVCGNYSASEYRHD